MRLIVGISGASGVIYGIRLLETLRAMPNVETHLVISKGGKLNIGLETTWEVKDVEALADTATDGSCSQHSLSGITVVGLSMRKAMGSSPSPSV
jgi:4-hydroxy-3-polyprenylbenzoate decarboxylase